MHADIDITPAWRDDGRLPAVTVAIHDRLEALVRSVTPHYLARLDIRIVTRSLGRLRDLGRGLESHRDTQAVVSADLPGSSLIDASTLPLVPVVNLRPTVADALHGLLAAGAGPIVLLMHGPLFTELEEVRNLLRSRFVQHRYADLDEARRLIAECAADPATTVVGDGVACDLAERAGLATLLLPTQNTVRAAFDEAIALIRQQRTEEARQERLGHLSAYLSDGVMSTDSQYRILSINAAMAAILGVSVEAAIGKPLSHVCAALAALPLLPHASPVVPQPCRIHNRNLLVVRLPAREGAGDGGSTLICTQLAGSDARRTASACRVPAGRQLARYHFDQLTGASAAIQKRRRLAEQFAGVDATVLITGESGTGKELFAQAMHNDSRRRLGAFVAINCAALPESLLESELFGYEEGAFTGSRKGGKPGLFENANGGTIFLDEIGDMPISLQTRMLRVLQEREVLHIGGGEPIAIDVRVIAATNRELTKEVAAGRFRSDLYYRLNVCHLHLPPLRERRPDIPELALTLLDRARERLGIIAPPASVELLAPLLPRLIHYGWPGNIREMENLMERLAVCVATGTLTGSAGSAAADDVEHLHLLLPELYCDDYTDFADNVVTLGDTQLRSAVRTNEADLIRETLAAFQGNRALAAKALGISRATLWRKLQRQTANN
ncbi:MAG: sigma 54-interacting transcriptional regulator [Proteobacteria bacterium]|nr:sigma 54-interacting transcriptional regulator [Pseudomonadota bacterium]